MKILAIDTTTFLGSIALVEDGQMHAAIQQGTQVTYSERLISSIHHLLEGVRWDLNDIDLIAVAIGPGSFTGLRIGLGTAKGLAVALAKPMVGVSSLEVLAVGNVILKGKVVTIIDARRDEVYASAYEMKSGKITKVLLEENVLAPDDLAKKLSKIRGDLLLVGDGARRYRDVFKNQLGNKAVFPNDAYNFPHGAHLASLAKEKYEKNGADDMAGLIPNYVRRSDAEIGFMGRHKKRG